MCTTYQALNQPSNLDLLQFYCSLAVICEKHYLQKLLGHRQASVGLSWAVAVTAAN